MMVNNANEINVLVAEDDTVLQKLLCDIIRKQGYNPIKVNNGQEAIDVFFESNISLCILDVMMPIYNGWEVLESIRAHSNVPIMMLTALGDEKNELNGLGKGANEYIAKPFSYPVFIARMENLLKNAKGFLSFEVGEIAFCDNTHNVTISNEEIELNNKEYRLLKYFITNEGIALTRDQILIEIWGFDYDGDIRTIDSHVKMLRKKLGKCSDYIQTVRGTGYKFKVINNENN